MLLQNYFMTLNLFIKEPFANLLEDFDTLNDRLIERIDTDPSFFSTFYSIRNGESSISKPETLKLSAELEPAAEPVAKLLAEPVAKPAAKFNATGNISPVSVAAAGGSKNKRNQSIKLFTSSKPKRHKYIKRKIVIEVK